MKPQLTLIHSHALPEMTPRTLPRDLKALPWSEERERRERRARLFVRTMWLVYIFAMVVICSNLRMAP